MEKLITLATSFLLIGGISWFFFGKKDKKETVSEETSGNSETFELNISGMHCAGCAAGIEGTIKSLPGVKSAQVNFATSKGVFTIDPAQISKEEIIGKIKELGYDASIDLENIEKKS